MTADEHLDEHLDEVERLLDELNAAVGVRSHQEQLEIVVRLSAAVDAHVAADNAERLAALVADLADDGP